MKLHLFLSLALTSLSFASPAWAQPTRIFVTSTAQDGNLGGIAGGDAICNDLAATAELGGSWVAWLSDANTDAISRLVSTSGPFVRAVSGVKISDDIADLLSGPLFLDANIQDDENGVSLPTDIRVHTGILSDGTKNESVNRCSEWTSSESTAFAGIGVCGFNRRGVDEYGNRAWLRRAELPLLLRASRREPNRPG